MENNTNTNHVVDDTNLADISSNHEDITETKPSKLQHEIGNLRLRQRRQPSDASSAIQTPTIIDDQGGATRRGIGGVLLVPGERPTPPDDAKGTPLRDLPAVAAAIQRRTAADPTVAGFHAIVFGRAKQRFARSDLLAFRGLVFPTDDETIAKHERSVVESRLNKCTLPLIRDLAQLLCLSPAGRKEQLVERIFAFIECPSSNLCARNVEDLTLRPRKRKRSKKTKSKSKSKVGTEDSNGKRVKKATKTITTKKERKPRKTSTDSTTALGNVRLGDGDGAQFLSNEYIAESDVDDEDDDNNNSGEEEASDNDESGSDASSPDDDDDDDEEEDGEGSDYEPEKSPKKKTKRETTSTSREKPPKSPTRNGNSDKTLSPNLTQGNDPSPQVLRDATLAILRVGDLDHLTLRAIRTQLSATLLNGRDPSPSERQTIKDTVESFLATRS